MHDALILVFAIGKHVEIDGVYGQILSIFRSRFREGKRETTERGCPSGLHDVPVIGVGGQSSSMRWPRSGEGRWNSTDTGEYKSSSGPHDVAVDGVGGQSSITRWAMSGDGRRNRIDIGELSSDSGPQEVAVDGVRRTEPSRRWSRCTDRTWDSETADGSES